MDNNQNTSSTPEQTDQEPTQTSQEASQLAQCQQEVSRWKDLCLRTTADFENYKKRTEREKTNWIRTAQANILFDVLTTVDDFDRALSEAQKNQNEHLKVWLAGFELTHRSLQKLLQKYDVHEIKEFTTFNPEFHEAIMQVESPDHVSGSIVSVLQKGYMFKGEVLRPAKVSVAQ